MAFRFEVLEAQIAPGNQAKHDDMFQLVAKPTNPKELPIELAATTNKQLATEVAEFFNKLIAAAPGLPKVVIPGR